MTCPPDQRQLSEQHGVIRGMCRRRVHGEERKKREEERRAEREKERRAKEEEMRRREDELQRRRDEKRRREDEERRKAAPALRCVRPLNIAPTKRWASVHRSRSSAT